MKAPRALTVAAPDPLNEGRVRWSIAKNEEQARTSCPWTRHGRVVPRTTAARRFRHSHSKFLGLGYRCTTRVVRTKWLARQQAPAELGLPPRRHIRRA